jgi:hypothetical protein
MTYKMIATVSEWILLTAKSIICEQRKKKISYKDMNDMLILPK